LKPFTEKLALAFAALLLTACASQGEKVSGTTSSAPVGPSDPVAGIFSSEVAPAAPPPEVQPAIAEAFEQAVTLIRGGRYRDAEIVLLGITSEQPELAGPWINLGQVYVALDQPEEARRAFEAAAGANPWNCTAYNELGLLSRVNGDFETAERYYLTCLERVPADGSAHLNLGILYELYLGRLPDALEQYRSYQQLQEEPDRRVAGWVMDLERRLGV
jgi:tetratricopeptide (TPR) repeat protein